MNTMESIPLSLPPGGFVANPYRPLVCKSYFSAGSRVCDLRYYRRMRSVSGQRFVTDEQDRIRLKPGAGLVMSLQDTCNTIRALIGLLTSEGIPVVQYLGSDLSTIEVAKCVIGNLKMQGVATEDLNEIVNPPAPDDNPNL